MINNCHLYTNLLRLWGLAVLQVHHRPGNLSHRGLPGDLEVRVHQYPRAHQLLLYCLLDLLHRVGLVGLLPLSLQDFLHLHLFQDLHLCRVIRAHLSAQVDLKYILITFNIDTKSY